MSKPHAAIFPASGIGDALIMMVASERLRKEGYLVTTFQHHLDQLPSWFPDHCFQTPPALEELGEVLSDYDLVIVQNDNSLQARKLTDLYRRGVIAKLSVFYYEYSYQKHGPLSPYDILLDTKRALVDNIAVAISLVLHLKDYSKNNGIQIPKEYSDLQKGSKTILIHPSGNTPHKQWPIHKFVEVAKHIEKRGYHPLFILTANEKDLLAEKIGHFDIQILDSLETLARLMCQAKGFIGNASGPSHLASLLHLPSIVLMGFNPRFRLWHPGWLIADVLCVPSWVPNIKGFRLKEKYWHYFIKPRQVIDLVDRRMILESTQVAALDLFPNLL